MDSDSDQESQVVIEKKTDTSRRPPNTAFRQQRLKAWQPILTPRTVLPLFFTVAAIFALFGGLLIWASDQIQEVMIDYTTCGIDAPVNSFASIPSKGVEYRFNKNQKMSSEPSWSRSEDGKNCTIRFDVPTTMKHPIYFFYRMSNFYQNHRRYVLSYNEKQIEGHAVAADDLGNSGDCKPLSHNDEGKAYYPCGLIANSMFNDTFSKELVGVDNTESYWFTNKGISWPSDRSRFKKTKYNASEVVPPPNWAEAYPDGYNDDNLPDVSTWEEFQNWMRTAGLPTFAKMALRNDTTDLTAGTYEVNIGLNFNTTVYNGKKYILMSTRTAIGGRNDFLGIAYCVVAGIAATLGIAFLTQHIIRPRRLGDHSYLSWNQPNDK
ncbi:aminophospholipid translocase regulatory protein [Starmerella bacillaris]|uniref:Aminophospholipid translocase regulatory protein n=1 Tax=Starmerella bacillaris TaxID=1247836 RepID=A0AAV5RKB8_STABA|nr:aminophospholipid translocase regulatory protein [Starmerella bacillaris]